MDRRAFLKLGALGAAGLMLPWCRMREAPLASREVPAAFRELAGEMGAEPSMDLFLGAKEIIAGGPARIPFALVDSQARPLENKKVNIHAADSSGEVQGPFSAEFLEFSTGTLHSHAEESEPGSPFESSGFYQATVELPSPGF